MTDSIKVGPQADLTGDTQPFTTGGAAREVVVTDGRALPADLPPGTALGDWRVEGRIGAGGMGMVYEAVHGLIGKRAAIKVVRAELCASALTAERFVQEARVVNQIGHPNIVDIFHIGRLRDGRVYLVMELLRGRTLADRMAEGRMSPLEAIDVLREIAAAASAAHAHGVVHRDLKPDNIFLNEGPGGHPTVKLVDWGIAKLTDEPPPIANVSGQGSGPLTTTGMLLGTPQYVSPEQARGRELDARTDIYSLGAIAYEMFLEGPPFVADSVADIVAMHLREPPPPPSEVWPDIPNDLEKVLLEMLAKDPDGRPTLADVSVRLMMVRRELEARTSNPSIRRLAAGSVPPAMTSIQPVGAGSLPGSAVRFVAAAASRPVTGREPTVQLTTTPARAVPTPTPSAMPVVPDLSGEIPALDSHDMSVRAGRRGWLWAAAVVGVCGAAAVAIMATRGAGGSGHGGVSPIAPETAAARAARAEAEGEAAERARAARRAAAPAMAAPDARSAKHGPVILEMRVTPARAWITIDGAKVEVEHGHVARAVEPGTHEIHAGAHGYRDYVRSIDVAGRVVLDVSLARAHHHSPTRPSPATKQPLDPNATIEPF
jgi:eukaryotic-like serine/threonine-protein kinase